MSCEISLSNRSDPVRPLKPTIFGTPVADLFINPKLPNYFVAAPDVTSAETARSFVDEFESGKVVTFPNLKAQIDHEFWSTLDTSKYPALRKFGASLVSDDSLNVHLHREALLARGVDLEVVKALCRQFQAIYATLLPAYRAVFGEYEFTKRKVVWRLKTLMNENMHLDIYDEERSDHFARMFINLDDQPRIWQTSWTADDLVEQLRKKIRVREIVHKSRADLWKEITFSAFGKSPEEWWDDQPRHVAYFAPGDVWIVDSRQVAHQIFYGRRALSIDFSVCAQSMRDSSRHYLSFVDRLVAPQESGFKPWIRSVLKR
jgi:hypothetical protein